MVIFGKRARPPENVPPQNLPPQKITTSNWGAAAAPAMAPADSDGISRVFSKELFQGEIGDFLRSAGFSPDAPGNIAQTAETFATMDARVRDKLAHFTDRANRVMKNGWSVKPLLLVPETVWQGEYRNFLCATCRLYPADPSNVFFLAGTRQTAATFGLPLQSTMSPKDAHDFAVQVIGILGDMVKDAAANGAQEAANVAYEGACGLGTIMAAKMFDTPHHDAELKLFGLRIERDFN